MLVLCPCFSDGGLQHGNALRMKTGASLDSPAALTRALSRLASAASAVRADSLFVSTREDPRVCLPASPSLAPYLTVIILRLTHLRPLSGRRPCHYSRVPVDPTTLPLVFFLLLTFAPLAHPVRTRRLTLYACRLFCPPQPGGFPFVTHLRTLTLPPGRRPGRSSQVRLPHGAPG